jgi:class 3 adenylate cyclase/GAF domain-containing protein
MPGEKNFFSLTIEHEGLYYRLLIIFSLFFLSPLPIVFYFAVKYNLFSDEFIPFFVVGFLFASLFGYMLMRKVFDQIKGISKDIADKLASDVSGVGRLETANELQDIVQSFQVVEKELLKRFEQIDRKTVQISTLKELSELCYVTFDTDDLLHITLERALKLANADVGSVLILDGPQREAFYVHATIGLGQYLKKGDRVGFADSIAKFAVINRSPLLINDVESDMRFARQNRPQYGTKSFLVMPLKGIHDVFGVLTVSRRESETLFTEEDVDVLSPLLSNAAFTYDGLLLMKEKEERDKKLKMIEGALKLVGSSLRGSELFQAVLGRIQYDIPYDLAVIMIRDETVENQIAILDYHASISVSLMKNTGVSYEGSVMDRTIRQENTLFIEDTGSLKHPLEQALFMKNGLQAALLSPLRIGGNIVGVLALGARTPEVLLSAREWMDEMVYFVTLAIEKEKLSESVTKRDQEFRMIKQIGSALASSTFDMEKVLKHTMDMIRVVMNVEAGSLLLLGGDEIEFKNASSVRIDAEGLKERRLKLGRGIAGYSAARGEPVVVREILKSPHYDPDVDQVTGIEAKSLLCVPLISQGNVMGVIRVLNKKEGDFDQNDLQLLQSIATSVSIAMENARLYGETRSLAEHERGIRHMFQKFVPKEVVDKIARSPSTERPVIDELKTVTLLNIDIRGFSGLSKSIGPQRTVNMLNYFFEAMGGIVFRNNGIVDKYFGDGFLAIFGAPVSSIQDSENAISAALEMQKKMESINEYFSKEIETVIRMGISMHTGEVVVGNIGFEKKMDYTVIGDSVNTVFRIQDYTKSWPNSILISEKTRQSVTRFILDVREIGSYSAGDAFSALKIYELLGCRKKD